MKPLDGRVNQGAVPDSGLAPSDVLSYGSGTLSDQQFGEAWELANGSAQARQQLLQMRQTSSWLARASVTDIRPIEVPTVGEDTDEDAMDLRPRRPIAQVTLSTLDDDSRPGYVRVLGQPGLPADPAMSDLARKFLPVQFLNSNWNATVPAGAYQEIRFTPAMFADQGALNLSISHPLYAARYEGLARPLRAGSPMSTIVSADAGTRLDLRYGEVPEELYRLVHTSQAVRVGFQRVVADFGALGVGDTFPGNFVIDGNGISLVDIEKALADSPKPWLPPICEIDDKKWGIAGQHLEDEVWRPYAWFARSYDSSAGRTFLQKLRMSEEEIENMIQRCRWFATFQRLPETVDFLDM